VELAAVAFRMMAMVMATVIPVGVRWEMVCWDDLVVGGAKEERGWT